MLANYAAETLKAKTIAIIDDRTAYGQGLADVVEKVAKEKGIKVVAREFTNDKATDFNAILTKIRGAKPDVVMYGGMDATAGPMAKQMKQLGIKSTFLAGDGVCSPEFVKLAGDAAGILTCSMAGEAVEKLAKGAEFVDKYKKRFNAGRADLLAVLVRRGVRHRRRDEAGRQGRPRVDHGRDADHELQRPDRHHRVRRQGRHQGRRHLDVQGRRRQAGVRVDGPLGTATPENGTRRGAVFFEETAPTALATMRCAA